MGTCSWMHLHLASLGQFALLKLIMLVEFQEPVLVSIMTMESLIWFLLFNSKECSLESRESGSDVTLFYYRNCVATFNYLELSIQLSGDVHPLPGPEMQMDSCANNTAKAD